jgi:ATP-dependent helicase/nuclease subunit A
LATVDLDADAEAVRAATAVQARMFGATDEEAEAAIEAVATALRQPVFRRAAASAGQGMLRRERPVLLTLEDGSLAEGVVDLSFRDREGDFDGWTVVDFKTDQEFSASSDHYVPQVRLHGRAVEAATALPGRAIVLVL